MTTRRTHEDYVQSIYKLALTHPSLNAEDRKILRQIKLTYGAGPDGTRGVTYYGRWDRHAHNGGKCKHKHAKTRKSGDGSVSLVAICATGQESHVQVCGTVLHELGHCISRGSGHGPGWHTACERLGLINVQAAGTEYDWTKFDAFMAPKLQRLGLPNDGAPLATFSTGAWGIPILTVKQRPCGAGYGTRGGRSRGAGSGSRLLLYECGCEKPVKIRHAGHNLNAVCGHCSKNFQLVDSSIPAAQNGD